MNFCLFELHCGSIHFNWSECSVHELPALWSLSFVGGACVIVSSGTWLRPAHTHASPSMSSLFARFRTCHTAPCNWMCWQHNDVGAVAEGGGAWSRTPPSAPHRGSSGFWGPPCTSQRCQGVSQQGGSNAISQPAAPVWAEWDVAHCIIYRTGSRYPLKAHWRGEVKHIRTWLHFLEPSRLEYCRGEEGMVFSHRSSFMVKLWGIFWVLGKTED